MEIETELDLNEEGFEQPVIRKVPVLCFISLVKYLFSAQGHGISIDLSSLARYWHHCKEHFVWGPQHPAVGHESFFVPVGLYGDGARYTTGKGNIEKVTAILANFILWCPASTRSSRFVLFAIRESMIVSAERTLWPIYKFIARQMNQLFEGVEVDGRPIHFALTECRGDWSWHCFAMGLQRRWTGSKLCFKCNTNGKEYTDYSDSAAWIDNECSHVHFLLHCLKPGPICNMV